MASTDKTPKLGLNQWAAGDRVLRTDFNEDNGKIEAGIEGAKALVEANKAAIAAATAGVNALAAGKATMVTGEYKGDGLDNRKIVLGFCPKLLVLQGLYFGYSALLVVSRKKFFMLSDNNGPKMNVCNTGVNSSSYLNFLEDGFLLGTGTHLNFLNGDYDYVAFG